MFKDSRKVILFFILGGSLLWVADTFFDYISAPEKGFWNLFILDVPSMCITFRFSYLLIFLVFGIVLSKITGRSRRTESKYKTIFDSAKVAVWEEDFSSIKVDMDNLKKQGIVDFRKYLEENPEFTARAVRKLRVVDVNDSAVKLYEAKNKDELLYSIDKILTPVSYKAVTDVLIAIAEGRSYFESETVNKTLSGKDLYVLISIAIPSEDSEFRNLLVYITDITERKKTEENLKKLYARLQALLNAIPDMVVFKDTSGRHLVINKTVEEFTGARAEDLFGKTVEEILPPDLAAYCRNSDEEVLRKGRKIRYEEQSTGKDGLKKFFDTVKAPIYNDTGDLMGLVAVSRDITERKEAEEALDALMEKLAEEKNKSEAIIAAMGDGISIQDRDFKVIYQNQSHKDLVGGHEGEHCYSAYEQKYHVCEGCPMSMAFEDGKIHTAERIAVVNNDSMTVEITASPLLDSTGKIIAGIEIVRNVTERKKADEDTRILAELVDASPASVTIHDFEGNFLYANQRTFELHGFARQEFLKKKLHEIDVPESKELIALRMKELKERGEASFEVAHYRRDGTIIPLDVYAKVRRWGDREVIFSIAVDITERKRAEESLRLSAEFIRNIIDNVDEGFLLIDRDYKIMTSNRAYCNWISKSCADIIGKHCYEISHKSLRPCYENGEECAVRNSFETGKPQVAVHRHEDSEGNIMYVETKAFPLKDSSGNVISAIETINNITEKHLLEEERLKTQKLEAIGTLAGGIAHDFNNLLLGVFGYISMAKSSFVPDEKAFNMLEQAEKALNMSVNLTNQLLTFSKGGKPVKKKISLRSVIENSVKFTLSGSNTDYRIEIDEGLRAIEADEGQIGQVIQNIVLNASEAMPQGGTIRITARNIDIQQTELPLLGKGKYVEIAIEDTGMGIPGDHLSRIFDPYFTTKQKGSGLGLATSYSIIKNHGGIIDVRSELSRGTTFYIYLPATEPEAEATIQPAAAQVLRKAKILVMDDEEIVRMVSEKFMNALGHEFELAENGEVAIEKYLKAMESGKPFDVVILDLTVRGGMGGKEAVQKLLEIDPNVKAVVSSGYSEDAVIPDYLSYGFKAYLTKPYNLEELRDMLNVLLT